MEQLLHNTTFDISILIGVLTPLLSYAFSVFIKMSPKRATYASRAVMLVVVMLINLIKHWHSRYGHVNENLAIINRETSLLRNKLRAGKVVLG